jgi:adenosine deaminase CECR1
VDTTARDASIEARLKKNFTLSSTSTAYTNERRQLLAQERKAAWDEPMRKSAKPVEVLANQLLIRIREHERQNGDLFGDVPGEKLPPPHSRDMGGRFLTNKDRIVKSKVFRIAEQMPKGSHLHLHFNAEIPPEILLPHARTPVLQETMFVRSTRPLLKPDDFDDAEIMFDIFPQGTKEGSLFSPDYSYDPKAKTPAYPTWDMGAAWMRWSEFRREFPSTGVRIEGTAADHELDRAEQWACQKMIITERRAYGRQTTNGAWACFNQGTRAFKGLLSYESVYRWYIGNAIDSMIRDKVMYAELRPMLLDKSIWSDDGRRKIGHKEQMTIVCEEMKKKEAELREKGQLHLFPFGLKIIYCTPRSIPRYMMETELYDCLLLKLEFPDLICGFDLVGAEDRPNSIGYYADLLVAFKTTCKEFGVSIPFLFHAGESLLDTGGTPDPENSNLYDCVLLNAKRIGHGNAILKHPLLMQQFRERKICLEVCPISDELLHLCGNAREHTFSELLAAGLHCSLNADNPSLFRYVI